MFEEQMDRIRMVRGKKTQQELAAFLNVRQSAVSDAKRRGKIPADWLLLLLLLLLLLRTKNILPEWILTGTGPCFASPPSGFYETEAEYFPCQTTSRNVSGEVSPSVLISSTCEVASSFRARRIYAPSGLRVI